MNISVVGTGYVGLVVAACLAENGNQVLGVDIDVKKIDRLRRGEIPIYEPGLGELVRRNQKEERLAFTTSLEEAVRQTDIVFIAVGTPPGADGAADMKHVLQVTEDIGRSMNGDKVIVLKSTVPVGTNRKVREALARFTTHRFLVVSNPEFLKEGAAIDDFMRPDRLVIGSEDPEAERVMRELYRPFVRTGNPILVLSPESAELAKYAANAMLATRVSFMNELARLCEKLGADVSEVRQAVGADRRIGHSFLFPGVGYGGSCFPKDIQALLRTAEAAGVELALVRATEQVNESQKTILLPKIRACFGGSLDGRTLGVWGLAFKPKTDDMREAPSIALVRSLVQEGVRVRVYDPEALKEARRVFDAEAKAITFCGKSYEACEGADGLILITEWTEFREPDWERIRSLLRRPVIFDGRNIYDPAKLKGLGFDYFGIGR